MQIQAAFKILTSEVHQWLTTTISISVKYYEVKPPQFSVLKQLWLIISSAVSSVGGSFGFTWAPLWAEFGCSAVWAGRLKMTIHKSHSSMGLVTWGNSVYFYMATNTPVGPVIYLQGILMTAFQKSKGKSHKVSWSLGSKTSTASCLVHSISESKIQDQHKFKRWENRLEQLMRRTTKICGYI